MVLRIPTIPVPQTGFRATAKPHPVFATPPG